MIGREHNAVKRLPRDLETVKNPIPYDRELWRNKKRGQLFVFMGISARSVKAGAEPEICFSPARFGPNRKIYGLRQSEFLRCFEQLKPI